jgi:hypothetical protein
MTVDDAKKYVTAEIARIESENPVGVLQPWDANACPAASEHWGLVQQRIALNGRDLSRACLKDLNLDRPERTPAQKQAFAAARAAA